MLSCGKPVLDGALKVQDTTVNVGLVLVGDSVSATFKIRNNTSYRQAITFLPECDCTTVSTECMTLAPNERGKLEAKVSVDSPGEFNKNIYVQLDGSEDFIPFTISGNAKLKE